MSTRMPPRYLPTLTEVVNLNTLDAGALASVRPAQTVANMPSASAEPSASWSTSPSTDAHAVPVNRHVLAQQIIQQVRPKLEAELRNVAQELFEAQFSALLPSLHLQIEEAVREALDQAMPGHPDQPE
jgi:hypothetical protein